MMAYWDTIQLWDENEAGMACMIIGIVGLLASVVFLAVWNLHAMIACWGIGAAGIFLGIMQYREEDNDGN